MQSFVITKLDICIVPRFFLRQNDIVAETKYAEKYANANLLFIQNRMRAYAISPYAIADKYRVLIPKLPVMLHRRCRNCTSMQSFVHAKLDFCLVPRFFLRQNDAVAESEDAGKKANGLPLFI